MQKSHGVPDLSRNFTLPGVKCSVHSIHKHYDGCDMILRNHGIEPQIIN
jgi:hypothetical protein